MPGGRHDPEPWGSWKRPWHCPSRHPKSHLHAPAAPTARLANATDWETSRSSSEGHMFQAKSSLPLFSVISLSPRPSTSWRKTQPPSVRSPPPPHPSLSVNPNASDLRLLSAVPPRLAFWWQSHQASVSRSADVLTA